MKTHSKIATVDTSVFLIPILYVVAIPLVAGCGSPSPAQAVVDHSSPEGLFASFCQALTDRDSQRLLEACDPPIRPTWKELLHWVQKRRDADMQTLAEADMLKDMERRFCGGDELLFERPHPDQVHVRNVPKGGQIALRKRNGKWYISFYDNPANAKYLMKLATEIIKSQLGARPASQKDVTEVVGAAGG